MGRMRKQTAEYFPHFVGESRTKFVLENSWGNDGYAFWFKLLELLCRSSGHYYDCSQAADMKYLEALTRVSSETASAILTELAEMGNIDAQLWQERKIIWCQSLVDNLGVLYAKRTTPVPKKPFSEPEIEVKEEKQAEIEDFLPEKTRKSPNKPEKNTAKTKGMVDEVVNLYNEICVSLPRCRIISEHRKKAVKARLNSGYTMEQFREAFEKAEASTFLKGSNDKNWHADFDWIINDTNIAKILDGKYDERAGANRGANRGYNQPAASEFKPSGGFKN